MEFRRYDSITPYIKDVLPHLVEFEAQNNLFIGLATSGKARAAANWLLATVSDKGCVSIAALCAQPFELLLFETGNKQNDESLECLARELRRIGFDAPGVMAESGLAGRFAEQFFEAERIKLHMTINAMRLDKPAEYAVAKGACRELQQRDMSFAPYWERAFSEDCRTRVFTIEENTRRLKTRLGKGTHLIWEDERPVSQAVHGRDTPNGAVINGVYTPPQHRGQGYATSVVAELSNKLLARGKSFCCLFADADNPASRKIYAKLGYMDVCELKVLKSV